MIVAMGRNLEIGNNGTLPWIGKFKKEFEYFVETTNLIPEKLRNQEVKNAYLSGKPSPNEGLLDYSNHKYAIVSKTFKVPESMKSESVERFDRISDAVKWIESDQIINDIWIIGGTGIYSECLKDKLCSKLYITRIDSDFKANRFFPDFDLVNLYYEKISESQPVNENGTSYIFQVWSRK